MIVVTGAAGFIGSCIVARLNERGISDLVLVDHMQDDLKKENLEGKRYKKYYDKKDFLKLVVQDNLERNIGCVIHMGACSSTTLQDKRYFEENNYLYSRKLAQWAMNHGIRFIYASSAATYGDGSAGYCDDDETIRRCVPLNLYGESKQKFDRWVLEEGLLDKVVGLKFFNVFGPNEYHKGDMRSVVAKAYQRVADKGEMALFKSYNKKYGDGEQRRDFIYVKDAVDIVSFFIDHPQLSGIYNVGTGLARTWNDLARSLFAAVGKPFNVKYIEMPEVLRARYQYFTQADMTKLKRAGYQKPFTLLEDAVYDYVQYLFGHRYI
ncbi:MAG: ADP-glyceromanno-heptose 6-epimerase [Candidatus Omnitrophica bacterium]|nr:ADP-glyceromanno-heptose 6-epimerase [Candidatus Omnitrophota bacterium]